MNTLSKIILGIAMLFGALAVTFGANNLTIDERLKNIDTNTAAIASGGLSVGSISVTNGLNVTNTVEMIGTFRNTPLYDQAVTNFRTAQFVGYFTNTGVALTSGLLSGQPWTYTNFFKSGGTNTSILTALYGSHSTNNSAFDLWVTTSTVTLGTNGSTPNLAFSELQYVRGPFRVTTNSYAKLGSNYLFAVQCYMPLYPSATTNLNLQIFRTANDSAMNQANAVDFISAKAIQE